MMYVYELYKKNEWTASSLQMELIQIYVTFSKMPSSAITKKS